jgi:outer membrane protein OmpA-like peptidoglycan-associated protein
MVVMEDGKQGSLIEVYFEPDTAILLVNQRPVLESIGRQLAANPSMQVLLRAYAAPFGTPDGQYLVSADRARFCRDFFMRNYGVASRRIIIEVYGADKNPEHVNEFWESHRCAEFIIFDV